MARVTDRMVKRVEEGLYPTEAMALWLRKTKQRYRSLSDLVQSLKGQPDEAWPLYELTSQAETAARSRLKNQAATYGGLQRVRAEYSERGERQAVRDIATLFYLFVGINEHFRSEKRALWLQIALAASHYARWIKDADRETSMLTDALQRELTDVYTWALAVDQLVDQYCQGECPLLGEAEEVLLDMVEHVENLVAHFNDHAELEAEIRRGTRKRKPALPKPLNLEKLKQAAQLSVDELVRTLVDMARADACLMMGEQKQAFGFAERHLS